MTRRAPLEIYVIRLRPERGVDAIKAIRRLLKIARRSLGLRALSVEEKRQ